MRRSENPRVAIIGDRPARDFYGIIYITRDVGPESAHLYNPLEQWPEMPNAIAIKTPRWLKEKRRVDAEERKKHTSFHGFPFLPYEIRKEIWEMAMPQGRVIYLHSRTDYFDGRPGYYPSSGIPELSLVCRESKRIVSTWGIGLRFCDSDRPIHCEWLDPRRDSIYIPSIQVFQAWYGWHNWLGGATVVLNVLETVEDQYRGNLPGKAFTWAIKSGHFTGIRAIDLAMLTIKCRGDRWDKKHDAYGEGGHVGVVSLDDERLPTMLRPVFNSVRAKYKNKSDLLSYMVHRRPSCLLKHLHGEWNGDLKFLFEEQWLMANLGIPGHKRPDPELFTDIRFGYHGRQRALNREHETIRKLIAKMPEIRPVIVFDRTPSPIPRENPNDLSEWNFGSTEDGLEVISNRRRMVLAYNIYTGRRTQYM
ncbi:hypothetical protein F4814DRAFT_446695 [Daldinia grandis]|nr:hypothetical protein F4814DRAFT_446695 [Daldinia grandis]